MMWNKASQTILKYDIYDFGAAGPLFNTKLSPKFKNDSVVIGCEDLMLSFLN